MSKGGLSHHPNGREPRNPPIHRAAVHPQPSPSKTTSPWPSGVVAVDLEALGIVDDEMCDWKGEAIKGRLRASLLEPGGVLLRECDDDQFIRREGAKRVLDRLHRVGITDPRLNVIGRCRLRKLVGPPGCLGTRVVLGVRQPVKPRDVGCWRNNKQLCILARVRTHRRAKSSRRDRGGGDHEQATRHRFSLSGSSTDRASDDSTLHPQPTAATTDNTPKDRSRCVFLTTHSADPAQGSCEGLCPESPWKSCRR